MHGDLHHDNILKNGKSWVAIDPKGLIGESAYDAATFIYNPITELISVGDAVDVIKNRISIFAETFQLPSERIARWCFVKVVLAWVWSVEDNLNPDCFERLTAIFYDLNSACKFTNW